MTKFTVDDVRTIRAAQGNVSCLDLAIKYQVSRHTIYKIWNRKNWGWVQDCAPRKLWQEALK